MAHEDGATRTLVKGLYLLCNDLGFSSSTWLDGHSAWEPPGLHLP